MEQQSSSLGKFYDIIDKDINLTTIEKQRWVWTKHGGYRNTFLGQILTVKMVDKKIKNKNRLGDFIP